MREQGRDRTDDMEQRVRRGSAGEPEAGVRAESTESDGGRGDASTSSEDAPDQVREEDSRAATERIERMQREGKGMGGTSTQGRADLVDEDAIEDAARGGMEDAGSEEEAERERP